MSTPKERLELEQLELPKMDPVSLFKHFGPGIIMMMTGVGTSHLITLPVAGGRFEFVLLWAVLISYIFKYYGFQMAFTFTNATGHSIMDAMCTQPGKWPIWYVFVVTAIQLVLGQAGKTIAAAAVLYFGLTEFGPLSWDLYVYAIILAVIACALVLAGAYGAVETSAKVLVIILALSAIVAFLFTLPPASAYVHYFIFDLPPGSALVLASGFGLLPTGIDVTLQASEWGKAKKAGLPVIRNTLEEQGLAGKFDNFNPDWEDIKVDTSKLPEHTQEYLRRWFKISRLDFALGHWVSFVLASIFLLLAATWLYPSSVSGKAVIGELAGMFTKSVGDWMMWVFLFGAFAACYSTAINYFDGWPRVIGACCRNLFKKTAELSGIDDPTPEAKSKWYSEYNIWRICMMISLFGSLILIIGVPKPVFLVLFSSAAALIVAPPLFFYNIYFCLKGIPEDSVFYPNKFQLWFSWISLVVFTLLVALAFYVKIIIG